MVNNSNVLNLILVSLNIRVNATVFKKKLVTAYLIIGTVEPNKASVNIYVDFSRK